MTKKQKIILYSIISIVVVIFLITDYQVFWSPFQILSKSDMEKNREGICLAEGRKLTDQELFTRAMDDYWTKWKVRKTSGENGKVAISCTKLNMCYFYKIPEPFTMTEFMQKVENRPIHLNIRPTMSEYFKADTIFESKKIENIEEFTNGDLPFSLLLSDYGSLSFFPKDCCSILSEQTYRDDFIKQDPVKNTELLGRGIGNYFLSFKSLSLKQWSNSDKEKPYNFLPNWLFMETYAIDNCGQVTKIELARDYQAFGIKDSFLVGVGSDVTSGMRKYFSGIVNNKRDIILRHSPLTDFSLYWTGEKFVKIIDFKKTEEYQRLREQAKQNAEREKEHSSN